MSKKNDMTSSLTLPCGAKLKNRLAKPAMSEGLANRHGAPDHRLMNLYRQWAENGAALLITGNVLVDRRSPVEPGNVVIEDERYIDALKHWAAVGNSKGGHIWPQINHPGRVAPGLISRRIVGPSPIRLASIPFFFKEPRALTEFEIHELIERFARTAAITKKAGFTGVQLHAAHGYLVSQFLSPLANVRGDKWGGALENRMRFLMETLKAMRSAVGSDYPIGVKINSADFQHGGFSEDDSLVVCEAMSALGVDLIEISGGTYEKAAMTGAQEVLGSQVSERTKAREAYFLDFARRIKARIKTPIMLTGGLRSPVAINGALESGEIDIAGIGRPLAIDPHYAQKLLAGENVRMELKPVRTGMDFLDKLAGFEVPWYGAQLARLADGKAADINLSPWFAAWHLSTRIGGHLLTAS